MTEARPTQASRVLPWCAATAVFAAFGSHRFTQVGPYPPGLDAGSWLLIGRGMLGETVAGAGYSGDVYPPLVPLLMTLGHRTFGAPDMARMLAAGSIVAVLFAVFAVARRAVATPIAIACAALVGLTFPVTEPAAFGGYPQNLGFAFGMVGVCWLARFYASDRALDAARASLLLTLCALSHHAYFLVSAAAGGVSLVLWTTARPGFAALRSRAVGAGLGLLPGALLLAHTAASMKAAGYEPVVNAPGLTMLGALQHVFREPRLLWVAVLAVGVSSALHPSRRSVAIGLVAPAFALVGGLGFLATAEPRLLAPLLLGSSLGLGLLAEDARRAGGRSRGAAAVLGLATLGVLGVAADREARGVFAWFRFVDGDYVAAARALDRLPAPGLAMMSAAANGYPVGWWMTGLVQRPVAAGSDERWLAYPRQKRLARLASTLFEPGLGVETAYRRAQDAGVDLLVTRKADYPGWTEWAQAAPRSVVFENQGLVVLDTRPRPGGR